MYGLLATDLQANMTQTQFSQRMTDPGQPTVTSASLTGQATIRTNPLGYPVYTRAIAVSGRGTDGVLRSYTSTILITRENAQWRFLGTDSPSAG